MFATGRSRGLAEDLGCKLIDDGTIAIYYDNETTIEDAYAAGWAARADKIQAVISGGGATAGLDILSKEEGRAFHDFDTPEDALMRGMTPCCGLGPGLAPGEGPSRPSATKPADYCPE